MALIKEKNELLKRFEFGKVTDVRFETKDSDYVLKDRTKLMTDLLKKTAPKNLAGIKHMFVTITQSITVRKALIFLRKKSSIFFWLNLKL